MNEIIQGDALSVLKGLPDNHVDCIVTSPPYWGLRDYGAEGQLGLEPTIEQYIDNLIEIFAECHRVLKKSGTCWVNIGDSYAGSGGAGGDYNEGGMRECQPKYKQGNSGLPPKSLCQIPERFSIAMTDRLGWIKRNTIIWYKRNCMPSSASDRFTVDFEPVYFFVKNQDYWFEQQFETLKESTLTDPRMNEGFTKRRPNRDYPEQRPQQGSGLLKPNPEGRNKRTVWDIPTESNSDAHFAVFPRALIYIPIKAGCPTGGTVLDPFAGSGTTCREAKEQNKNYIGIELNPDYVAMAEKNLSQEVLSFETPSPNDV